MWIGCNATWPAETTAATVIDAIAAWMIANAGGLEIQHTPGVSLEWKSRAPIMERGHFKIIVKTSTRISGGAVHSPAWSDDPLAVLGNINWDVANQGKSTKLIFDNATGRMAAIPDPVNEWSVRTPILFDVMSRPISSLPISSASVVAYRYDVWFAWASDAAGAKVANYGGFPVSPVLNGSNLGYSFMSTYGLPTKATIPFAGVVFYDQLGSGGTPSMLVGLVGDWADGDLVSDMVDYEVRAVIDGSSRSSVPWPKPGAWTTLGIV